MTIPGHVSPGDVTVTPPEILPLVFIQAIVGAAEIDANPILLKIINYKKKKNIYSEIEFSGGKHIKPITFNDKSFTQCLKK